MTKSAFTESTRWQKRIFADELGKWMLLHLLSSTKAAAILGCDKRSPKRWVRYESTAPIIRIQDFRRRMMEFSQTLTVPSPTAASKENPGGVGIASALGAPVPLPGWIKVPPVVRASGGSGGGSGGGGGGQPIVRTQQPGLVLTIAGTDKSGTSLNFEHSVDMETAGKIISLVCSKQH